MYHYSTSNINYQAALICTKTKYKVQRNRIPMAYNQKTSIKDNNKEVIIMAAAEIIMSGLCNST